MPCPDVDLPNHASSFDSPLASVGTDDSRFLSDGSFDNSYEAHGPLDGHHIATTNIVGAGHQFAVSEEEEDGHRAWDHFGVSPTNSLDHLFFEEEDSSGMIMAGAGDMDDSMTAVRGSITISDDRTMLNNEYESLFEPPSATASQVLPGVGAAFGPHFVTHPLRLSPECRHSINHNICTNCTH